MAVDAAQARTLEGRSIAITGRLASMSREEAIELVERQGGRYSAEVDESTSILVIGQEGWPLSRDGRLTHSMQRAQELQERGVPVQILREAEFMGLVGLGDSQDGVRRLYTSEQLRRILDLSREEIRAWIRSGLITPAKTVRRLCYFDFEQVSSAKALGDLRRRGVATSRITKSLEQLERWLPSARRSLAHLGLAKEGNRLLMRLGDGRLADLSGQLQLDFPESETEEDSAGGAGESASEPSLRLVPGSMEDWFEAALRHEEAGELELAGRAYHKALLHHGPKAEMCFNLGNVLYAQGRRDAAAQRYMQAVEIDPEYVEAWNNLGNVFSELDRLPAAVEAFEQALRVQPDYADAHFNIGECLHQLGQLARARHHWEEYLRYDPHSSWARRVEQLLAETESPDGPQL